MKAPKSTQIHFLQKIEDLIPTSTSIVSELSDLLEISMDSAYRRIRGETSLSLDEIVILCNHFNISFDSVIDVDSGTVTFSYTRLTEEMGSFEQYIDSILNDLRLINGAKQQQIIYACEDIPVFHNYRYPDLAAFKFFYWMKSILNVSSLSESTFSTEAIPDSLKEKAIEIIQLYSKIPSIEIWTDTTISSTIKQIEFYWEAGIFNTQEDALKVCDSLKQEIVDIQKQAEIGGKFAHDKQIPEVKDNYTFYFSEIELTNNCVLVNLGETKAVYISHFTFSTMSTTNHTYCAETEKWLNNIIKKSTLISGVSQKLRYQFFKKAYDSIDDLIAKIK